MQINFSFHRSPAGGPDLVDCDVFLHWVGILDFCSSGFRDHWCDFSKAIRKFCLRENQEAKKAHLQKYIDLHSQAGENGVKAAKQRKSKMKKLEKVGMMAQGKLH